MAEPEPGGGRPGRTAREGAPFRASSPRGHGRGAGVWLYSDDDGETYYGSLTPKKWVRIPKNTTKIISIDIPDLMYEDYFWDLEPIAMATFVTSRSNPKYIYVVGALYNGSYTMVDKEKF